MFSVYANIKWLQSEQLLAASPYITLYLRMHGTFQHETPLKNVSRPCATFIDVRSEY